MIIEPPSVGYELDANGNQRPVAFMRVREPAGPSSPICSLRHWPLTQPNTHIARTPQGRINGQYITEGLTSSFLYVMGGVGFIALDYVRKMASRVLERCWRLKPCVRRNRGSEKNGTKEAKSTMCSSGRKWESTARRPIPPP